MDRSCSFTAIVPMRQESERVPGKNYRSFCDRPLYHRIIQTLLAVPLVSSVVIDTDSPVIMTDAAQVFPGVTILIRPEHLRGGDVPMNDVLIHTVSRLEGDLFLQCHSTSPLLKAATITRAIERYLAALPVHDSLFSVTRLQTRLWNSDYLPLNHDPENLMRTQDLPPVYEENSAFYLFSRSVLQTRRNRIGKKPLLFEIDRLEAWDIDEEFDFVTAEYFYSQLYQENV
jgi:CMP-N-acetylneuraminic acid synthetase